MKTEDIFCEKCGEKNEPEVRDSSADYMPTVADDRNITVSQPVSDDMAVYNGMLKQIWPDWTIVAKLGEGSFGKVYKAERNEMGTTFTSAIKIISIPKNDSEIETIRAEAGLDEQSTSTYFRTLVDDCVNEIKMMESFKGTQNIVSVEDYKVVPCQNKIGWTIFIRMELLTSFIAYTKNKVMTEKDVIKLGIDICSALECCAKLNVMHRDIKPENIFVSSFGDFKLGDFGIARKLEKTNSGMSMKGTYNYMAPEIYGGNGQYDYKSDIYSLGIVLYKLLNNNRFPLVDAKSNAVTYQQMQKAFEQRMSGAKLPRPMTASDALSNVVLVACAFDPEDRFSTASALKAALMNVQSGRVNRAFDGPTVLLTEPSPAEAAPAFSDTAVNRTVNNYTQPTANRVSAVSTLNSEKKKKEKPVKEPRQKKERVPMSKGTKAKIIVALVLAVLLAGGGTGAYLYLTSPGYRIRKEFNEGNYEDAVEIFLTDGNGEASRSLTGFFEDTLEELKNSFIQEETDFESVTAVLAGVDSFNIQEISEKAEEIRLYTAALNEARMLYEEALTLAENGSFAAAIEKFDAVIAKAEEENGVKLDTSHFDYDAAVENKAAATDSFRQAELDKAEALKNDGNYTEAFKSLEEALKVLEGDALLTETLDNYRNEYNTKTKQEHLEKAEFYEEKGNYERAIRELNEALEKFPDDAELSQALVNCQKEYEEKIKKDVFDAADKAIEKQNYAEAVTVLRTAADEYPDINEIYLRYTETAKEYKRLIIEEVDALVSNRKTSEALALLEEAMSVIDAAEFVEKKSEIEGKQPVSISTLPIFAKGNWKWNEGTAKDPFGNTYTDKCNFVILDSSTGTKTIHEVEYNMMGKNCPPAGYSTITGSIVPYETMPENSKAVVKVFVQADEDEEYALAYSSPDIKRKTEVFDFVADITGAKYITIVVEITGDGAVSSDSPDTGEETAPGADSESEGENTVTDSVILMDVQLWP